jgi:hypothetical protein
MGRDGLQSGVLRCSLQFPEWMGAELGATMVLHFLDPRASVPSSLARDRHRWRPHRRRKLDQGSLNS